MIRHKERMQVERTIRRVESMLEKLRQPTEVFYFRIKELLALAADHGRAVRLLDIAEWREWLTDIGGEG